MQFRLSLKNESYDQPLADILIEVNAEEIDPDEPGLHIIHPSDIKRPRVCKTKALEIGEEVLSHIAKSCGINLGREK